MRTLWAMNMSCTIRLAVGGLALCSLLFAAPTVVASDKGKLRWMSMEDALSHARKAKKKVLIDVYTDWCGWCKKMDKDTYADKRIRDYLARHYAMVKLNAESKKKVTYNGKQYTEQELAASFGVTGYPSAVFLKTTGEPLTIFPGYAGPDQFKTVISFLAEDHYLTKSFEEYAASVK